MDLETVQADVSPGGVVAEVVERVTDLSANLTGLRIDPDALLRDVRLDRGLEQDLSPHFKNLGYDLETKSISNWFGIGRHQYTAAVASQMELAILQIPTTILKTYTPPSLSAFNGLLTSFRGVDCRMISENVSNLTFGFGRSFKDNMPNDKGKFINWDDIQLFRQRILQISFSELFGVSGAPGSPAKAQIRELADSPNDIDIIIEILARMAQNEPAKVGVEGYFRSIVLGSDWPEPFKMKMANAWTGIPMNDAQGMVSWLLSVDRYPGEHTRAGQRLVGWFLWDRIEKGELGSPDDARFAKIIIDFVLVEDQFVLNRCQEIAAKLLGG